MVRNEEVGGTGSVSNRPPARSLWGSGDRLGASGIQRCYVDANWNGLSGTLAAKPGLGR